MWTVTEEQKKIVDCLHPLGAGYVEKLTGVYDDGNPTRCVPTNAAFFKLYYDVEMSSNESGTSSSEPSQNMLNALREYDSVANTILTKLGGCRESLKGLMEKYESVAQKTTSLHEACDKLMADQTNLASAAEEIRSRLSYFDHAEQLIHKLSSPNLMVTGESFMHILSTIDECMTFLASRPDYNESATYLNRYRQCLSKALSLAKQHVVHSLSEATQNVQSKLNASQCKEEDTFILFYGQFATHAPPLHSLMENLESRWDLQQEYQNMLSECYQHYISQRETLLLPSVTFTIQQLMKKHSGSCCSLVRSSCSFLLRTCDDEYRLFFQFFCRTTPLLHDFLEKLSRVFYDYVRPVIIHLAHLETLSEICSILKNEILEERVSGEEATPDAYIGFVHVLSELIGDVTERLVYRAQLYAEADILRYNPAPGDLAYPEKLQMMQEIARSTASSISREASVCSEGSAVSQEVAVVTSKPLAGIVSAADLHGLWYPTVRRTVMCLSKLYRCSDATVFQGMSQEIIAMCIQSLTTASEKIMSTKGPLNSHLFLIKHLLILREQTVPFRGSSGFQETNVDFSKIKESARSLFTQRSRWFSLNSNNAFLEFLFKMPANVTDQITDSRRILDEQLKKSCQRFINEIGRGFIAEIADFNQKADIVIAMANSSSGSQPVTLTEQAFAKPEIVHNLVAQWYKKVKEQYPVLQNHASLYIGNRETENILLSPIKKMIETAFIAFAKLVSDNYSEEQTQVIACPSLEEVTMLLSGRS